MSDKIRIRIINTLAILALLSIPILTAVSGFIQQNGFESTNLRKNLLADVLLVVFFFANYYYLIPRFFLNKQEFKYFIFVAITGILVLFLPDLMLRDSEISVPFNVENVLIEMDFMRYSFLNALGYFFVVLALSLSLKINDQVQVITDTAHRSNISPIQSQINPHFLFNALNSLYALTIAKNDSAPDVVIKLSNMLRYIVAESGNDRVRLSLEIEYITNYISVQRLRIAEGSNLEFAIHGDPTDQLIRPIILIPFIENAFKYGVNEAENWHISIMIEIVKDVFNMKIQYNKLQNHLPKQSFGDVEIEVAKDRLSSAYRNAHSLKLENLPNAFQISLQINLI